MSRGSQSIPIYRKFDISFAEKRKCDISRNTKFCMLKQYKLLNNSRPKWCSTDEGMSGTLFHVTECKCAASLKWMHKILSKFPYGLVKYIHMRNLLYTAKTVWFSSALFVRERIISTTNARECPSLLEMLEVRFQVSVRMSTRNQLLWCKQI